MKTIYAFLVMLLLTSLQLPAQTWQWTKPEPNVNFNPNGEHDDAHDVEVDASGNAYVLGDFLGSLFLDNTLRATGSGSYLAKYDSTGALLWYKLIIPTPSTSGYIKATDLTVTVQGVFITGKYSPTYNSTYTYNIGSFSFVSDVYEVGVFVTKFNANGVVAWNRLITGSPYVTFSSYNPLITSDKNNNIICEFLYNHYYPNLTNLSIGSGTIPLPLPVINVYNLTCIVFKMNNAGTLLWSNYAAEQESGSALDDCNSIIADNNGNVFLYGKANDGCAFGSNIFHTTEYIKNGNSSWSTYIAKISAAGAWQFVKELNNFGQNNILASGGGNPDKLAVDNSNNIYAAVNLCCNYPIILGDTVKTDKTSAYLVKLDNTGNLIWHKGFGSNETTPNSISFANNSLYVSGRLRNYVYGNYLWYFSDLHVQPSSPNYGGTFEYFISKANTNGDFQWATTFSGDPSATSLAEGLAVKAFNNNVYTSGYYRGNTSSLGNLKGNYTGDQSTQNIFFGKLKDQYIKVGAVSANQVMPGCKISIPFTSSGLTFSAGNSFIAELSNINWEFTNPTVIGSVASTGNGVINAIIPVTLPVGTSGYKIRIRSTDTLLTGFNYFAYADTGYTLSVACPGTASGLSSTNITGTAATVNWAAVGCASGYKVQYRVKGTSAWTTKNNNSSATSSAITGLVVNTIYQWRISTKCSNNGVNSYSANSPLQQFTTAASFALNSATEAAVSNASISLFVQPNPAKASAVLVVNGSVKNGVVTITDFVGKTIWKKEGVQAGQLVLPVQNFAAGIYIVKLVNGNETKIVKLVKE